MNMMVRQCKAINSVIGLHDEFYFSYTLTTTSQNNQKNH